MRPRTIAATLPLAALVWSCPAAAQVMTGAHATLDENGANKLLSNPVAVSGQSSSSRGNAGGASDLTAGTLRVTGVTLQAAAGPSAVNLYSTVDFADQITLIGPTSTAHITLTIAAGGKCTSTLNEYDGGRTQAQVVWRVLIEDVNAWSIAADNNATASYKFYGGDGGLWQTEVTTWAADPTHASLANGGGKVSVDFDAMTNQPIWVQGALGYNINSDPVDSVTCDYGNTAHVTLTLPPGFSFRSQTGVFLSNTAGPGLGIDGGNPPMVDASAPIDGASPPAMDASGPADGSITGNTDSGLASDASAGGAQGGDATIGSSGGDGGEAGDGSPSGGGGKRGGGGCSLTSAGAQGAWGAPVLLASIVALAGRRRRVRGRRRLRPENRSGS